MYEYDDGLRAARGFYNGGLISIVLWLIIICAIVAAL
jgi:hypothetical protein